LRRLLIAFCIVALSCGCAKKVGHQGIAFDFDKIVMVKKPPEEEKPRDKGKKLAKEGKFEEAAQAYKKYVIEDPESYAGFNALAVCYKNLGDHAEAMKNFERALEFAEGEERAIVLANIGNLYYSAKRYQVALDNYREAAKEFDKNPRYLILVARAWAALNEMDRARKVLATTEPVSRRLVKYESDEDTGLGYHLMAEVYASLNEEEKVYKYLEAALKASPERSMERIQQSIQDEKNLLYTLKDDPALKRLLDRYATQSSGGTLADREGPRPEQ